MLNDAEVNIKQNDSENIEENSVEQRDGDSFGNEDLDGKCTSQKIQSNHINVKIEKRNSLGNGQANEANISGRQANKRKSANLSDRSKLGDKRIMSEETKETNDSQRTESLIINDLVDNDDWDRRVDDEIVSSNSKKGTFDKSKRGSQKAIESAPSGNTDEERTILINRPKIDGLPIPPPRETKPVLEIRHNDLWQSSLSRLSRHSTQGKHHTYRYPK